MSLTWHGYISFDLSTHTAGDQISIMTALKAELNETPTSDQPAERWHTAVSGGVYVAEAVFDLAKLNTANLNTVAQSAVGSADLTGLWEPMRLNQSWLRSLERSHEFIDTRAWDIYGYDSFIPASNSLAHVQAAIDLAVANGSGVVDCTGLTIDLAVGGTMTSTLITIDYGLWVDGDDVWIKNGTFQLTSLPSSSPFAAVVFGNGGASGGSIPGENGTWRYGNGMIGSVFTSALTDEERSGLGTSVILLAYCQDWFIRDISITNAWGELSVIGTMASCRYGHVVDCAINGTSSTTNDFAFWFDGGRYITLANCTGTGVNAFKFQSNLDNTDYATSVTAGIAADCTAVGNVFTEIDNPTGRVAFGATGCDRLKIINNTFSAATAAYFWSKFESYTRATDGTSTTNDCEISGNIINCGPSERPFYLEGVAEDANEPGIALPVLRMLFQDNTVNGATRKGYFGNALASGCSVSGNTYDTATVYGYANANDEETIEANNDLQ